MKFPDISGKHCEFTFRDGYWYVRDLGSTNGTKVNGTRVQEKLLHPKDEVTIGRRRRYMIQYELPVGRTAKEEIEEDIMSRSLLEKAGLERSKRDRRRDHKGRTGLIDPADILLNDDDD
jgi:adenylate cyclase